MKSSITSLFRSIVSADAMLDDDESLIAYSYDAAQTEVAPQLVIFPKTTEEISAILRVANDERIPVTPRGAGSGLSGGSVPVKKGVVLCLDRMTRVIQFDAPNRLITVEPGVITAHIDPVAAASRLFFPPDPGSHEFSTIGGNVAENAGGLRGLKYGVTEDYVKTLKTVLPTGEVVDLGAKTVKHVAGLPLEKLMVGSEGTLGIFTEITLALVPVPTHRELALAIFDSVPAAAMSVAGIIAEGITPSTLEIMDQTTIAAIEDYQASGLPLDAAAVLLIETDGHPESARFEMDGVIRVLRSHGARSITRANDLASRTRLFNARRVALSALARRRPSLLLEDATVKRTELAAMVEFIQQLARRRSLEIGLFGHAGDGNLHPTILFDQRDANDVERVEKAVAEIFEETLRLGGTISGEHGIGLEKKRFLPMQIQDSGVAMIRAIKRALDPNDILNPGKIV